MKFFRIDLLTLLISLFILGSCKNPDGIGLGIDPNKAVQATLVDTTTINTTTMRDDSVLTNSILSTPLSYFKDPDFGTTEANIAASLNLPGGTSFTVPTGTITIDSAVLVLPYADGFYGDSVSTRYQVNVFQLKEPLVAGKAYYNTKAWSFDNSTLIGNQSFTARPKTGRLIKDIVTGGPDTNKIVAPQVRIPITNKFITDNFFNATSSQLATNSVFLNAVKGLYITLNQTQTTGGPGGTMYFGMGGGNCSIQVYYRVNNAGTIDTTVTTLGVGNPHAVQIKHTYTNAAINTQLSNPTVSSNTLYLQGLSGLRAKISFPYLKNLLPANLTVNDIVLNRAELVVTPTLGSGVPYVPTPRLTLYRFDIAQQRIILPDASGTDPRYLSVGSFGGFYDKYHNTYNYIITGYVEDLMRGKTVDYGTFIAPADTTGMSTGNALINVATTSSVAARAIVGGNKTSPYKIKLNIIYSKVSK